MSRYRNGARIRDLAERHRPRSLRLEQERRAKAPEDESAGPNRRRTLRLVNPGTALKAGTEQKLCNIAEFLLAPHTGRGSRWTGFSVRLVADAVKVAAEADAGVPELPEAVRQRVVTVSDAVKVISEPAEIKKMALDLVKEGDVRTVVAGVRRSRRKSPVENALAPPRRARPWPSGTM